MDLLIDEGTSLSLFYDFLYQLQSNLKGKNLLNNGNKFFPWCTVIKILSLVKMAKTAPSV